MEPSRFDELTKALATATSRRQALKTIAATTLGGLLGLGGIGSAFAKPKCHRNGLGCDTNSQCCSGYCDPTTSKCAPPPCLGLQQPCTSASQCCDTGQGKTTCENNTLGVECCNTPGGSCSNDFDCCGLTLCGSNGTCQCQPSGHECLYNTDCCSGTCNNSGPGTGGTCA